MVLSSSRFVLIFLLILSGSGSVLAADTETATLRLRFAFDGAPPKPVRLADMIGASFCGDTALTDQRLVVNPINRGIQNIVVYAYDGPGGEPLPAAGKDSQKARVHELVNVNCNYEPRIVVMRSGDSLSIHNTDILGYNSMLGLIANQPRNFALPPKSKASLVLPRAEPAPIPVECTIYPWMKARLLVLDHRWAGVSDGNGELSIHDLPVARKISLRIYHEAGDMRGVTIGELTVNRRSIFSTTLTTGINDLGKISLAPDKFDVSQAPNVQ